MGWLADRVALAAAHARSVAAGQAWLDGEPCRALRDRFDAVAAGDVDGAIDTAVTVLADRGIVAAMLAPLIEALQADPLFEPPFRVHRDPLRIGAVLFDHPAVSISAGVLSADALSALPRPATVVMTGRHTVVRYHRAAGATLARWRLKEGVCEPVAPLTLTDGVVLHSNGGCEASLLTDAPRDVATVTAMIRYGAGPAMNEFAVAGGAPVRRATLDDGVSRTETLMTLLRWSGRADAGPQFEAVSRHDEHHLRWTAMREWLALDVRGASERLEAMAVTDPHPDVRAAAAATLPMVRRALCPA